MSELNLISNDHRYEIKAKLVSFLDEASLNSEKKRYKGSRWTVKMYRKGEEVDNINGVHFGSEGGKLPVCKAKVKLSKNTILFAAYNMGYFSRALKKEDVESISKKWNKEYSDNIKKEKAEKELKSLRKLRHYN